MVDNLLATNTNEESLQGMFINLTDQINNLVTFVIPKLTKEVNQLKLSIALQNERIFSLESMTDSRNEQISELITTVDQLSARFDSFSKANKTNADKPERTSILFYTS